MTRSSVAPRLAGWWVLVGVVVVLGYADTSKPPKDVLFRWSTAAAQLVFLAILLGLALALAAGAGKRDAFGLRRPLPALPRVAGAGAAVVVAVLLLNFALSPVLHADQEQGLTTGAWVHGRVPQFAANFLVFAIVGPVVEELVFRGLGYRLLREYGEWTAIVGTGIAFGLWHGLLAALPILVAFGLALAWLRSRTGSVYPCIAAHVLFNAIGIAAAMAT